MCAWCVCGVCVCVCVCVCVFKGTSLSSLFPTPLPTPKRYVTVAGLSAGAIAGICVGAVILVAAALLFAYHYRFIKKSFLRNIKQIQVSRKIHIDSSPNTDTEFGGRNSSILGFSPGAVSPVSASQSSTALDVRVVSNAEDSASISPRQPSGSEPESSIILAKFIRRSAKYQPLVLEEADIPDSNSTPIVYTREL